MMVVGWIYYYRREYDRAIEQYTKTLESDPQFYPARFRLGLAYAQKRMYADAVDHLVRAASASKRNARIVAFLGYTHALSGDREGAATLLRELETRARQTYVSSYDFAVIHLGLGDMEQAVALLDKAADEGDGWVSFLEAEPMLDGLRSQGGFGALARRVNLPR
jgi:tetratricopeptide (TPR) repeat protein